MPKVSLQVVTIKGLLGGPSGKEPACQRIRGVVWSRGWEDPLEEGMAIHASIFAWGIS